MFNNFRCSGNGESARAGWLLVLSLLLTLFSTSLWAGVSATLDRSAIAEGDTVTLTIKAEGQHAQGAQPDLSPLQKDFTLLGTSTSQQMQIINGRMSSSASLRVELEPKHGGRIEIPALKVGGETTAPLTLTVAEQPAATASQPGSALYLETEVEPHDASTFVQQQIQYTTRLYYSMPLTEGSLGDPAGQFHGAHGDRWRRATPVRAHGFHDRAVLRSRSLRKRQLFRHTIRRSRQACACPRRCGHRGREAATRFV